MCHGRDTDSRLWAGRLGMDRRIAGFLVLALMSYGAGSVAWADDAIVSVGPRMSAIPEHTAEQTIQVPLTPCWRRQRVPRYVELETPIYEWQLVDAYVLVPSTRTVDVVQEECVPTGERPQCGCGSDVTSPQPSGASIRRRTVARGPVAALEKRKVEGVKQWAWVKVDTKVERRCVGYEWKWVDLNEGKTRSIVRCVTVPAEVVTVVPDGTEPPAPLPGSARVLTESEWRKAVNAAWSRPPE